MSLAHLLFYLVMGLLVAFQYLRYRDLLYPPVLQAGIWTVVLVVYGLMEDEVIPLSPAFYGVVLGGTVLFGAGAYLATRNLGVSPAPLPSFVFSPKPWLARLLFWLPLVGLGPFLLVTYRLGQEGTFDSFYQNIRFSRMLEENQMGGGGPFGVMAYLQPLSFAAVLLQTLQEGYRHDRRHYLVSLLVAFAYAFLSTGRTSIILLLVSMTGLLLVTRRVSPHRTLLASAGLMLVIFGWMGVLVGLAGGEGNSLGETLGSIFDLLIVYLLGPLPAFDAYLQLHLDPQPVGANTFRTVYAVLAALGFDVDVVPLIQEYVMVPFPTNVYTLYQPYFTDFAFAGVALAALGTGYLHGFLYRKATQGHLCFVLAYALSLYPLVFQFYQDNYLSLLSLWVQYGIVFFLYFYRLRITAPAWLPSTSSS